MRNRSLPRSDLSLLAREVLDQSPVAALPSQLSDTWLDLIGRDLDVCLGDLKAEKDASSHMAAPLALVIHLLSGKQGADELQISLDKLREYLTHLQIEIALELLNRKTNIRTNAAVLETIFENREVSRESRVR